MTSKKVKFQKHMEQREIENLEVFVKILACQYLKIFII